MNALLRSLLRSIRFDERACAPRHARHELRFTALLETGRGCAFPCDAAGNVDLDGLTDRSRAEYFYARTTIGREFRSPVTCCVGEARCE
jgi:hypothetical protein